MKNIGRLFLFLLPICLFPVNLSWQSENYRHNLLIFRDNDGKVSEITNADEWQKRRKQILSDIQQVMGSLPDSSHKVPLDLKVLEETNIGGIRLLKVTFAVEKGDRVPAYLLMPASSKNQVPGVLCLHQTISIGKAEPAGEGGSPNLHYALELARRGYVTLAPDYPNFGDYTYDPYSHGYLSASMKGIWNHMAAIDLLQSLPEVDPARIACIGHSLGGHNSLFLAVFDTRIKAVVSSCGFTSFSKYYNGDLTGWSHKGYMPRIASDYEKDPSKMPFDFPEILGAIAPRALFINAPLKDSNFEISGVYDCVRAALPVFELLNAGDKLKIINPDAPHDFPPESRNEAYMFLDRELSFNNN
jgi:pimeloyl-ACP methyl ester carboxylesterase